MNILNIQTHFYDILESVCSKSADFLSKETIILGDFNTDVAKLCKNCTLLKTLNTFMDRFHFKQLIVDFTRVCQSTATIIDLILVSDNDKILQSGVMNICISDHLMTYCTRKDSKNFIGIHNTVKIRSMKNYNKTDFEVTLLNADWSSVMLSDNVSAAWDSFKSIFVSAVNNVAPLKQVRIKQRTEPWMTQDILQSIKDRDFSFNIYKKDKTEENLNTFRKLRCRTQRLIHWAKHDYFKNKLEEKKSDSKSLWAALKNLGLPSKKSKSSSCYNVGLKMGDSDEICFDKQKVSEKFNDFYTTVASKLVEKLPRSLYRYGKNFVSDFYSQKGVIPKNFSFSVMSENQILKYLSKLSIDKSAGLDGIHSKFVRDSATVIACPFTHIINLSLIQGVVPDDLKSARVIPLFKKNDKTEVSNFRPVSILCILSKVFERVVYDQVDSYLIDKNLVYEFQSGFRKRFSTDT